MLQLVACARTFILTEPNRAEGEPRPWAGLKLGLVVALVQQLHARGMDSFAVARSAWREKPVFLITAKGQSGKGLDFAHFRISLQLTFNFHHVLMDKQMKMVNK